ncbi:Vsp/OspC family lipoprotein (plasmid) [Borrelia puertoricensis]|uniref:Vsp/OspC family lipoprotein n=1 Tax=Borrelia puertoricensis TaxID=2756107 RepID=UPI003EBDAA68
MKRITLCALLMTLFLLISCNNSGAATKDGQAAKSDGTVIDLVTITKNITDAVAFAKDVKDVHTLVKSIDELAKAIGKKIKDSATELADNKDKNTSLIAGAFNIVLHVKIKLAQLEKKEGISDELKTKVTAATAANTSFLNKLKEKHADLGKEGVTDAHAKSAIDITDTGAKDKGTSELIALNTSINALLKAAEVAVESAINELTTSDKPSNT